MRKMFINFKNEANLKSLMSKRTRINQLLFVCVFLICTFSSCRKEEEYVDLTYHLECNEDFMSTFAYITVTYLSATGVIVQENVQLPWQKTIKGLSLPVLNNTLIWVIGPLKQNYPQKDSYIFEIDVYATFTYPGVKGEVEIEPHQSRMTTIDPKIMVGMRGTNTFSIGK